jgi:Domain of unknown function DUF29
MGEAVAGGDPDGDPQGGRLASRRRSSLSSVPPEATCDMGQRESDDLYERDFVAWAQAQAAALRARGAGANTIDWERVAEEIEDMGRSEVDACESYLILMIEHALKIMFTMNAGSEPHWRREYIAFRGRLRRKLSPSIRMRLEPRFLDLYREGCALADASFDAFEPHNPKDFPEEPPFRFDDLLDSEWLPQRT